MELGRESSGSFTGLRFESRVMNTRHTSGKSNWITPPWLIDAARSVLGRIDVDPASSAQANKLLKAQRYFTEKTDGLSKHWYGKDKPSSVWLNPPGGKLPNGKSSTKAWWGKMLIEWRQPYFGHGLFLAFSIEAVQTSQLGNEYSLLSFPTCFFKRRIAFIDPVTGKKASGMTHSSCLTYLAGETDQTELFAKVFSEYGIVTWGQEAKAA